MIKSSIEIDGLINKLTAVERKGLPGALVATLNQTIFEVRSEWVKDMGTIFDRPIGLTVNSPRYTKATAQTLFADAYIRNEVPQGTPPSAYLFQQVKGGPRAMKPSERFLGHYYVPGPGAQLDRYGNLNFNTLRAILAAVGGRGPAPAAGFRRVGGARANRRKRYFILHERTNRLRAGVYERTAKGIQLVLIFLDRAPQYEKRFDPEQSAARVVNKRFAPIFYGELTKLVRL